MSQAEDNGGLATDATYYTATQPTFLTTSIDVPTKQDSEPATTEAAPEFVTIDFDEIDNAADLIDFLKNEQPSAKYWALMGAGLSDKKLNDGTEELVNAALEIFNTGDDNLTLHNFRAWFYIRKAQQSAGSKEDVENLFNVALQSVNHVLNADRTNTIASLAQAEIFYQKEDYERALDLFDRVIKYENDKSSRKAGSDDEKSDVEVYASLGRAKILFKRKNYAGSLRQFQAVLILRPVFKPDARIGIGMNFWRLKDKKLAIAAWERAVEIDPKNVVAKLLLTLAKFDSSFSALIDDDFVEKYSTALDSLNELLKEDSEDPVSLLLLASYYYSIGELDNVVSIGEKVLSQSKISSILRSDANFWIARVNYERKDHVNAQKHYSEASKANPENVLSKFGFGQAQYRRDQLQESIITFENILKDNDQLLEVNYVLGVLFAEDKKTHDKAIKTLEKYVRLATEKNEPIILNSYLVLSKLYENRDNNMALSYLSKSLELLKSSGLANIPAEILNNIGVFHFIKGNPTSAKSFFSSARKQNESEQLEVTLLYNEARATEQEGEASAVELYNLTLQKAPGYIYSKIRLLYTKLIKIDFKKGGDEADSVSAEVESLLEANPKNLEVRAFYAWYLKKANKSNNTKGENLETKHNKETLVSHDSHDAYALISLGNLYCSIAREIKGKTPQDIEKRNQSYVRGATLFQKVLHLDPHNVFAAQGIAIIFVENKLSNIALETFRKIRDSIDDVSVYVNLGHCLLEVGQHAKAIESYEIALKRYGDDSKDSRYLTLIGRAWYARAVSEKSLESYLKSLECSKKSLEVGVANGYTKLIPSLKYNVAFIENYIGEFIVKLHEGKRTVEDLEKSIDGLTKAKAAFEELSEEKYPPLPADILKERAAHAKRVIEGLESAIVRQKVYEEEHKTKIQEAKKQREIAKKKQEEEEAKRREAEEALEAEKREMNRKLQEQAAEWEKEREEINSRLENDVVSKKGKRKDAILTDEELSGDEGTPKPKRAKKSSTGTGVKRTRKKKDIINDDEDEDEDEQREIKKRKNGKVYKSADVIEDSDEGMSDFVENDEDDDVEREEKEEVNGDDDEDDGLF